MFFLLDRQDKVELPPSCFGKGIEKKISDKLKEKVEGKCTGRYGYTILVARIQKTKKGRLDVVTGNAHFMVNYQAIVFKPYKNEVLPTEVSNVTDQGFWANAGPLEIFISCQHIPSDFVFNATDKEFISKDEAKLIKRGSRCRVKILGMTVDTDKIITVGTMKGSYLGTDQ
ncbi:hypothetical protein AAMO2058_000891700 [Amorphochlora amoebiformis]|uniref:DNA-directed RNA polymerase II subunit RPB7 n=1 Tax=Amorphochlora amoebiformis TaxID=1561963 RepID=A0A7S0DFA6_9EUKA|mmetsp:Transcript_26000/g.41187  ORF Transcript_26000/g.41187 Transcript_26000/m.41187 type:complete len:171 (+) Transcript_26000:55-567(+)